MSEITTQAPRITSLAIEVKVIRIGNKQMTKAVYSQLPTAPLIDKETFKLDGVPWGNVNVHSAECEALPKHLHTIWQHGDKIYKATVFNATAYCNSLPIGDSILDTRYEINKLNGKIRHMWDQNPEKAKLIAERAEYEKYLAEDLSALEVLEARYEAVFKTLTQLDQLFIAV